MAGSSYYDLPHVTPQLPPKNLSEQEFRAWERRSAQITLAELAGSPGEVDREALLETLEALGFIDTPPPTLPAHWKKKTGGIAPDAPRTARRDRP